MSTEEFEVVALNANPVVYPHSDLTRRIIGAAIDVHRELGCGFLEKVYEKALNMELAQQRVEYACQVPVPINTGPEHRLLLADLVVARTVLCEIKALDCSPVHESQLLHYLKATGIRVGLLLNFGITKLQVKRRIL
jgi:GxxExxY protein